jgi:hypothetical protein
MEKLLAACGTIEDEFMILQAAVRKRSVCEGQRFVWHVDWYEWQTTTSMAHGCPAIHCEVRDATCQE